jgi:hypothetical protein
VKKRNQINVNLEDTLFARVTELSRRTRYSGPQLISMCLEAWLPTLEERLPDVGTLLPAPSPAAVEKKRRAA